MVKEWNRVGCEDFDLALTMQSGQFFLYEKDASGFVVRTQGETIALRQEENAILHDGDDSFVRLLLGIDNQPPESLREDPVLSGIMIDYSGLRLMNLDLYETILSFICSSNSNIPRIRKNLDAIAKRYGTDGHLPRPGVALDEAGLRELGLGYRAKYLAKTSEQCTPRLLSQIKHANYGDAHQMLASLPGVGPKVADCICLFALNHGEAFPVDVHLLRAMKALFPNAMITSERRAKAYAQNRWGEHAGLAQQFIFCWARENLKG